MEAEVALIDLKGLAAPAVIVHFPTILCSAAGVGRQPVLYVRVIGADDDFGVLLIKLNYSYFLAFFNPIFVFCAPFPLFSVRYARGAFFIPFSQLLSWKKHHFLRSK